MTYLVTGAAGFIAARVVEMLLEAGHEVVAIDNLNAYYDRRLKWYRLHRMATCAGADADLLAQIAYTEANVTLSDFSCGNLHYRTLDIEDNKALEALFTQYPFAAVLNLAARAGVRYSMENPHVYQTTNAHGVLNLLEWMQRSGVKKFVLASTSSLYAGQPMPFVESLPVNTPISPYAASKKAAEVMAYTYHHLYDIDVSVLRYFTVFGPAGRPDMSPFRFIKWIAEGTPITLYGDGSQARDFTYVDDVARGTIAALKPLGYEIINIGGGNEPVSLKTMIHWMETQLGKKAAIDTKPFHQADMKETWADITKANKLLDWQPKVQPQVGFERTTQWYLDNQKWASSLLV